MKKTTARIRKHFTWPGISADIKALCTTCPQCQKTARNDQSKAPLIPLPVINIPFSRIAFDVSSLGQVSNMYSLACAMQLSIPRPSH